MYQTKKDDYVLDGQARLGAILAMPPRTRDKYITTLRPEDQERIRTILREGRYK